MKNRPCEADFILHRLGEQENLLVIEVKSLRNATKRQIQKDILIGFLNEGYYGATHLVYGVLKKSDDGIFKSN